MALEFTTSYIKDATTILINYKRMAERAMAQVSDEELFCALDTEANSIAVIVQHLMGNFRSRWRDFLATDGEKPDRDRDAEFEASLRTRAETMALWEAGWKQILDTFATLSDADLSRTVTIRNEPHSVLQAINRALTHTSYHVGQIVLLAKHFCGERWNTLSIPKRRPTEASKLV
jgi:hypothetical protein